MCTSHFPSRRIVFPSNAHVVRRTLFGGPSQPEPTDPRGGIQQAYEASKSDEAIANPNQYENHDNWRAHYRWTGPQLYAQSPDLTVVCAGLGTSGTMTGIGQAFKELKPSARRLAVCTAPGERVPGPRTHAMMAPVKFPWRDAIDDLEEVGAVDAFATSLSLTREGLVCGPSSGLNLFGKRNGNLSFSTHYANILRTAPVPIQAQRGGDSRWAQKPGGQGCMRFHMLRLAIPVCR